jgi:hypothetical protein
MLRRAAAVLARRPALLPSAPALLVPLALPCLASQLAPRGLAKKAAKEKSGKAGKAKARSDEDDEDEDGAAAGSAGSAGEGPDLDKLAAQMERSVGLLLKEYHGMQVGRATLGMLDSVQVGGAGQPALGESGILPVTPRPHPPHPFRGASALACTPHTSHLRTLYLRRLSSSAPPRVDVVNQIPTPPSSLLSPAGGYSGWFRSACLRWQSISADPRPSTPRVPWYALPHTPHSFVVGGYSGWFRSACLRWKSIGTERETAAGVGL